MRKIILTLIGATLIAGSTGQVAFAKASHHVRAARQCTCERFRNANANADPYAAQNTTSSYSGGMGGWASMTGID
jgi:hypothetical protein